jgi:hypothetical protein
MKWNDNNQSTRMPLLTKFIWVYFLLLIFEGALRKWIVPALSTPLLLIRDPVAIAIIWEAYKTKKWPKQWTSTIAVLCAVTVGLALIQLLAGDNVWFIAIYGLRSYLLPFPVAFIVGSVLTPQELRQFGRWTLVLLMPLTLLQIAQYYAPASSFLNVGANQGSDQLAYAGGHVRASGTFSYVTGPTSYIPLAAAFIFYGMVNPRFVRKWLLWSAGFALIIAIPVTGSRSLLYMVILTILCVLVAAFFGVSQFASSLKAIAVFAVVALAASQLPVFHDSAATFTDRLTSAAGAEGNAETSVGNRVLAPITGTVESGLTTDNWFGHGIGIGSNVAASILHSDEFAAGEGEAERLVYEFGAPAGLLFLIARWALVLLIAIKALGAVRRRQPLAWLLVPPMVVALGTGTLEQTTIQGFMVMTVGFTIAALRVKDAPARVVQKPAYQWKPRPLEPRTQ